MKNSKSLITALFVFLFVAPIIAQEDIITRKEIGIQVGTSFTAIHETRYSNLTKRYVQPKYSLYYQKWNNKKRSEFLLDFTMTTNLKNPQNLWFKIIHPEVLYTYQRKVNKNWIGGYFHSSTVLNFPKNTKKLFGNNPISYTIAQSLGLAVNRTESLIEKTNYRLDANLGTKIALLSHVIRPIHGHPYPEHFLQEDVFTPTRDGLGSSISKSGKIQTLDKYQNMKLTLGLNYIYKNRLKVGFQYQGNFQKIKEGKQSSYKSHDLTLGLGYLF